MALQSVQVPSDEVAMFQDLVITPFITKDTFGETSDVPSVAT